MTKEMKVLLKKAYDAIGEVGSDKSGDFENNLEALEELQAEIEGMVDGLRNDIDNRD